ncbi:deoxyuridine 5'-triphosphate nucleotidohydrolase [Canna indica]|uniref:dUTP diphosphatase n=1 Tax=Canna indica TaxID=4628 RepID=A0AAQ3JND9_9LILI|nr:deoxyuridine 5'-triphosphate nucleotidohydrolase [Canna indica]
MNLIDILKQGYVPFNFFTDVDFEVKQGDRVAKLILEKIMTSEVCQVDDLESTIRGIGKFGSTGV